MLNKTQIIKLIKDYGYTALSDSDGVCACGALAVGGIHIRIHCHRSGRCCEHSGIHVWKDQDSMLNDKELKTIGDFLAKRIEKDYMTFVDVKITTVEKERKLGYVG